MVMVALALAAYPVAAQDYQVKSGEPVQSSESLRGAWAIRDKDCRVLRRHVPVADVQHQPGADAAPADLNPGPDFNERARNFAFAITVVTDDYLPPVGPFGQSGRGEGFLGFVEIRDGVPFVDGEPLGGLGLDGLATACGVSPIPRPDPE